MAPTQTGGLPPRPGSQHSSIGPPNTVAPSASNSQVIPVSGIENIGQTFGNSPAARSTSLNEFLSSSNTTLTDVSSSTKTQSSDPVLSEILDAVSTNSLKIQVAMQKYRNEVCLFVFFQSRYFSL